MKNTSKNKFLTCFRPVVDIDAMLEPKAAVDRPSSRRFSCIPVADEHETKFLDQENWVVPHPPKRKLAKVIKAVVFETILHKRAQYKNRFSQDCFGSKRRYSEYSESPSTGVKKSMLRLKSVDTNVKEIKAHELSSPSSSSSSPVPKSKDLSKCDSSKEQLEKQKLFKCVGVFLVLISLAVTVFWGKLKGIVLTSICLSFFSLLVTSFRRLKEVVKLWNTESKAYKNMEPNHNGRAGPKELYTMGALNF